MQQLQIRKIINENFLFQNDDDSIPSKPNRSYFRAKRKLPDASALVVVPDHNFIRRVLRVGSAANESQNITSKEHLDNADAASTIKVSTKDLAEGIAIVDPEAMVSTGGEAAVVLVEREMEERGWRRGRRNRLGGRNCGVEARVRARSS